MSLYWVSGATTATSPEFISPKFESSKIHVLSDGDDNVVVAIQFENPDGTFRSFPDTELTGKGAKEVTIPRDTVWKVDISSGTAANVEVKIV